MVTPSGSTSIAVLMCGRAKNYACVALTRQKSTPMKAYAPGALSGIACKICPSSPSPPPNPTNTTAIFQTSSTYPTYLTHTPHFNKATSSTEISSPLVWHSDTKNKKRDLLSVALQNVPIFYRQNFYSLKMPCIVSHENQIIGDCRSGDEYINIH